MKLLLTSGGISNPSIRAALDGLLGKPVAEASALCIPTASYGMPGGMASAQRIISGTARTPLTELGWASLGVLELTALPSIDPGWWVAQVRQTDALLVGGGDAGYLAHWMRASGLADLIPELTETVWVGVSGGSLVMTPRIGAEFRSWTPPGVDDAALGVVGFSIFPHVDHPELPDNSMAEAERWAAGMTNPAYAIDDATAIRVVDGEMDVVSEGAWRRLR
jgi:dipeptidase E